MHTPNICGAAVTCRTEARGEIHMCAADARDGRPEADPRAGGMEHTHQRTAQMTGSSGNHIKGIHEITS